VCLGEILDSHYRCVMSVWLRPPGLRSTCSGRDAFPLLTITLARAPRFLTNADRLLIESPSFIPRIRPGTSAHPSGAPPRLRPRVTRADGAPRSPRTARGSDVAWRERAGGEGSTSMMH